MRRFALIGALVLLALSTLAPGHVAAQGFSQIGYATFTTDVTLTTTTEKALIASGPVTVPRQTANVCILAWAQLTTGTMTTTVTPRIRRGTAITGTAVGDAVAETILATAGSIEPYFMLVCEDRANVATVEYVFTLQQAGSDGDGSALQGGILVFVR